MARTKLADDQHVGICLDWPEFTPKGQHTVPEYSRRLLTNPWGITCDRTACHSSGIAMHPVPLFCRNWDTCANVGAKKKKTLRENEIRLH